MKPFLYAHFLWHALRLKFDQSHRVPLTVHIQVTYQCNNHCRYCYYDRSREDLLTTEKLIEIFQDIYRLGGRRINFTGGEPLLRNDLLPLVKEAKAIGLFVSISTNGYNVEKQLEALRLCDQVMLSFDGPEDVRRYLCGEQSAKDSARAVELFNKNHIPFWTTTVLAKPTLPHIEWLTEHARRYKSVANFVLLHTQSEGGIQFHPHYDQVRDLLPTDEEIRGALRKIIALKKKGTPIGSSLPYLETMLLWPDFSTIRSNAPSPQYRCLAGRASCEMTADGLLFPCGWLRENQPGVSVLTDGFASAFKTMSPSTACRSCASSCWLESNLIFNLNVRTVYNWVKLLLKK